MTTDSQMEEPTGGSHDAPKVFMSYSHDSIRHKTWVLTLAEDLCKLGTDPILDSWDLKPGQDVTTFMSDGISSSKRVILVCTKPYVDKSNRRTGGVGYEDMIISSGLLRSTENTKYLPIIRDNPDRELPQRLGSRLYIDFSEDSDNDAKLEELARQIHETPATEKPAIGNNPFKRDAPHPSQSTSAQMPVEEVLAGDETAVRERCRVLYGAQVDEVDGRLYELRVDGDRRYALPSSLYRWHLNDNPLFLLRASGECVAFLVDHGYFHRDDDYIQLTAKGWKTKSLTQVYSFSRNHVFEFPQDFRWYKAWRKKGDEIEARQQDQGQ